MNKLLQTTLIAAILSTGVMATDTVTKGCTGALPNLIESGATVYVNKDIIIGSDKIENAVIDNYGFIDTQLQAEPYPTIKASEGHSATINNHSGIVIKQEEVEAEANTIKGDNPVKVEDVELDKVYKITENSIGKINDNLKIDNTTVTVVTAEHRELIATNDFIDLNTQQPLTGNDLLFLGKDVADTPIIIRGENIPIDNSENFPRINCNFGDRGATNTYNLQFKSCVAIGGDVSNFQKGNITVSQDEDLANSILLFENRAKEINAPITVEAGILDFTTWGIEINNNITIKNNGQVFFNNSTEGAPATINNNITISNGGSITFNGEAILKSGATLTIGETDTGA